MLGGIDGDPEPPYQEVETRQVGELVPDRTDADLALAAPHRLRHPLLGRARAHEASSKKARSSSWEYQESPKLDRT